MSAPVKLPTASGPAVNADRCGQCPHPFHGLACAKVDIHHTGAGIVQTPCACPGPWAAA